jgi:N-acylneuraminate cytidylyltransferase
MSDRILFVIPARGGSKGIPHKNIKPFAGRPLIAYSLEAARARTDDAHIILSTDDERIAEVAKELGYDTAYRRPAELATDTAGSREVILDAMDYADAMGVEYDKVVLLQPTSPLRTVADIVKAIEAYDATPDCDMAVTVTEAACNPYYDCFETDADGVLHVSKGDGTLTRRQDAPKAWQYNGAVYVMRPESVRRYALGAMPRRIAVEMPRSRSMDLDTPLDWTIAEMIYNDMQKS